LRITKKDLGEISGSHGGEYEECFTMLSGGSLPTFQRCLMAHRPVDVLPDNMVQHPRRPKTFIFDIDCFDEVPRILNEYYLCAMPQGFQTIDTNGK
jgi:hypothetical protein